jgi:hypothetical protein
MRRQDRARKSGAAKRGHPLAPNEEAISAMREARTGKLPRFKNAKDLLRDLNKGD